MPSKSRSYRSADSGSDEDSSLKGSDKGTDYGSDADSDHASDSDSDSASDSASESDSDDDNPASDMCVMMGTSPDDVSHDLESDSDSGSDDSDSFSDHDDDRGVYRMAMKTKNGEKGRGYLWPVGETLRVRFLDGSSKEHSRIMKIAKTWEKYANIHFKVVHSGKAQIRITLEGGGYSSQVGTSALKVKESEHTMRLSRRKTSEDKFQSCVLHEFGHALGCIHEHSSPGAKIPWDKKKVYQYYGGPPNNWTREQIDSNVLNHIESTLHTSFDKRSIMLYTVRSELTKGRMSTERNSTLSDTDKKYIGKMYPFGSGKGSGEGSSKGRRGKR